MIEEIRKRQDRLITSVNQTQSPEISVSDNDDKTNRVSQSAKISEPKLFRSLYIDDDGKWTYNAVDNGYVKFTDYLEDRRDSNQYSSYNNRPLRINDYQLQGIDESGYMSDTVASRLDDIKNTIGNAWGNVKNNIKKSKNDLKEGLWAATNFGTKLVAKSREYSKEALDEANKKAVEWGLNSTWNNKADAYRHFIWNVKMTRDSGVGYYGARNITNRHEYETMLNNGWVSENGNSFDYKKDNTIISGKMNQETLMDLWNNQVGRELANNKDFRDKTESELFDLAMYWELLITDANTVYKKLGIENYVGDDYLVEADWNLTTGEVTVRNKWGRKRLKIGV